MKSVNSVFRGYISTIPFAGALVMGWDFKKTSKWTAKERAWELAEDLTLTMVWPITGPSAVKRAWRNMEFGPFYDDD